MILSPVLRQRYFDSNGNPLAGGKLYSYQAGTTTPQATYANAGGTPNTNPVVLDANGEANVWIDPSLAYKFILTNSSDVTQWTVDQVTDPNSSEIPQWSASHTYSQGSIVRDDSGEGLLYVSLADSNAGNALTSTSHWRIFDGKVRTITSSGSAAVTDNLIRSNSTSGNVIVTLPACVTTPLGKMIQVKDVGTGGNTTSVRGNGSDTVDGDVTYATALRVGESIVARNMGTRWDVVASYLTKDGSITTAKVAAAGLGTAALADGAVTQAKRAALGQQISGASGSFTTASGTKTDVTNLSVSITTTGRPVMITLISDGGSSASEASSVAGIGSGAVSVGFYILRDGVEIANFSLDGYIAGSSPPGAIIHLDPISAGTYVYKLQANVRSGSGSPGVYVIDCKLVAFEL